VVGDGKGGGVVLRQEASFDSLKAGTVAAGVKVRVEKACEVGGERLRVKIAEPKDCVGWTTARMLICGSGNCGRCHECDTALLPSAAKQKHENDLHAIGAKLQERLKDGGKEVERLEGLLHEGEQEITKLADGKGELENQLRQASEAQGQEAVASARLLEEALKRAEKAEHMVRALKEGAAGNPLERLKLSEVEKSLRHDDDVRAKLQQEKAYSLSLEKKVAELDTRLRDAGLDPGSDSPTRAKQLLKALLVPVDHSSSMPGREATREATKRKNVTDEIRRRCAMVLKHV